jgi:hypothetical protein
MSRYDLFDRTCLRLRSLSERGHDLIWTECNVAHHQGREIRQFATAVFDLEDLPPSYRDGPPTKDHPLYYDRPWKTIQVRTVADGGTSYYPGVKQDHTVT